MCFPTGCGRRIGYVQPTATLRGKYQYNNIMYMAADLVVGAASGGTWEEFVQQRIFAPLGMTGANFRSVDAEAAVVGHCVHYRVVWENGDGDIDLFTDFMRSLPAPPRGPITAAVARGSAVFNAINCDTCHVPTMIQALTAPENKSVATATMPRIENRRTASNCSLSHAGV